MGGGVADECDAVKRGTERVAASRRWAEELRMNGTWLREGRL